MMPVMRAALISVITACLVGMVQPSRVDPPVDYGGPIDRCGIARACALPGCLNPISRYSADGCLTCPVCPSEQQCDLRLCLEPECANPTPTSYSLDDGTVCTGCPECPTKPPTSIECARLHRCDSSEICKSGPCRDAEPRCELRGGSYCRVCDFCPSAPVCDFPVCPDCVAPPAWKQTYDRHGCPIGCPPCGPVYPHCPWWNRALCHNHRPVSIGRRKCMGCTVFERGLTKLPYLNSH